MINDYSIKTVISSQLLQLKKNIWLWLFLVIYFIIPIMEIVYDYLNKEEITYSGSFILANSSSLGVSIILIDIILCSYIMGHDYANKTILIEIATGFKRKEVFWGRALLAIIFPLVMSVISMLFRGLIASMVWGYGNSIEFSAFLIRMALYMCIVVKVSCETILVIVLIGRTSESYALTAVLYGVGYFTEQFVYLNNKYILSIPASQDVLEFPMWVQHHFKQNPEIGFSNIIRPEELLAGILVPLLIGVVCISIARRMFEIEDMVC